MAKSDYLCFVVALLAFANGCGGTKQSSGSAVADHLDEVLAGSLGTAAPGSIPKITVTRGKRTTYDNGKVISVQSVWICEGETDAEVAKCQNVGAGDPHCTNTPKGTTCVD